MKCKKIKVFWLMIIAVFSFNLVFFPAVSVEAKTKKRARVVVKKTRTVKPKPKKHAGWYKNGEPFDYYSNKSVTIKYPDWPRVGAKGAKLATSNQGCTFAITTDQLGGDSSLKSYVKKVSDEQKKIKAKILNKEATKKEYDLKISFGHQKSIVYQYTHGVLASGGAIYNISFLGAGKYYDQVCKPLIAETVNSIKLK